MKSVSEEQRKQISNLVEDSNKFKELVNARFSILDLLQFYQIEMNLLQFLEISEVIRVKLIAAKNLYDL